MILGKFCPRPRMEQTVSTAQDHKSRRIIPSCYNSRLLSPLVWATRMGFIPIPFLLLLELFSILRLSTFCFVQLSLTSEHLAYRVPKSISVLRPLVLVWQSEKKTRKWKKKRKNAPTADIGMLPASPQCRILTQLVILVSL